MGTTASKPARSAVSAVSRRQYPKTASPSTTKPKTTNPVKQPASTESISNDGNAAGPTYHSNEPASSLRSQGTPPVFVSDYWKIFILSRYQQLTSMRATLISPLLFDPSVPSDQTRLFRVQAHFIDPLFPRHKCLNRLISRSRSRIRSRNRHQQERHPGQEQTQQ